MEEKFTLSTKKWMYYLLTFLCFLPFFSIYPRSWNFDWDNWQYIILCAFPLIVTLFLFVKNRTWTPGILPIDCSFLLFLSISFLSFFWATNTSLIWHSSFTWLSLFLAMLVLRTLLKKNDSLQDALGRVLQVMLLLPLVYVFFLQLSNGNFEERRWLSFIGKPGNYFGAYLTCLLPFIFYSKNTEELSGSFKKIGKIFLVLFCFLGVSYVSILNNSAGVLLGVFCVGLGSVLFLRDNNQLKKKLVYLLACMGIFYCVVYVFPNEFGTNRIAHELQAKANNDRLQMIYASIKLFWERPLLGIGTGNWGIEAYKFGISEFRELNSSTTYKRFDNHDFFSKLLSETGLLGMLGFLFFFTFIIVKSLYNYTQLSVLQRCALVSLGAYALAMSMYAVCMNKPTNFSVPNLIAFVDISILTFSFSPLKKSFRVLRVPFIVLFFICIGYFFFSKYCYELQKKGLQTKMIKEKEYYLSKSYYPSLSTMYRAKTSISFKLAILHAQKRDTNAANYYFSKAVNNNPNNGEIRLGYANYLFNNGYTELALECILPFYEQQPNFIETNLLLSKIYHATGNTEKRKSHFEKIKKFEERFHHRASTHLGKSKKVKKNANRQNYLLTQIRIFFRKIDYIPVHKDPVLVDKGRLFRLMNRKNTLKK